MKKRLSNIAKISLAFILFLAIFSPANVNAEQNTPKIEQMVLEFFEAPDSFVWFDSDGNDVTQQFYNDNLEHYINNELETIMADFRSYIVSGIKTTVEEVPNPNSSIQVRACIGDCPGNSTATYAYYHSIYNSVYSSTWGGYFDAYYNANGYYYVENGQVVGISTPTLRKDPLTDSSVGTEYFVTLYGSGTPNLSTKKVNYSVYYNVRMSYYGYNDNTYYYTASVSIYSDGN